MNIRSSVIKGGNNCRTSVVTNPGKNFGVKV